MVNFVFNLFLRNMKTKQKYYFIKQFNNIELKNLIKVNIELAEDGDYILTIKDLNLFSYGKDLFKTQEELKFDLGCLHTNLFIEDLELANSAKKLKENFKKYLQ